MQDTKHSKKNKPRSASELRLDEATVQGIYRKPDEELIIGNKGSDAEFKPEYSIIPIRKNFDDRLAYDQEPESFHREHGQMGEPIFINEIENALQEIEEISTHETTSKDQRRR